MTREVSEIPHPSSDRAARRWVLLAGLALVGLCLLVWGRLLGAEFSNDDELLIVGNLYIRDFSHLWENVTRDYFYNSQGSSIGYWRPLTKVTYMLGWAAWGADPRGYYGVNVALFTLVVLVAGLVVRRTGAPGVVAFGAAALAAVHPAHAESVGIVTSRSDLLAALFLLGVLAVELGPGRGGAHARGRTVVGLVLATLALLSKEVGVIAPLLVGVAHLALGSSGRGALGRAAPYLVLVAAYAALRLSLGIRPAPGVHADVESARMALATCKVAGIYAARLFVPFAVEPITRPAVFPTGPDATTLTWCAVALVSVVVLAVLARRRSLWLALGLVVLPVAPALSLRYVSISVHADRLPVFDRGLILPSIGVGWLLALGLHALAARLAARGREGRWLAAPALGWLVVLALGAYDNVLDSQTAESRAAAFTEGLEGQSEESMPLFQRQIILEERAIRLAQSGDLEGAERVFGELIELDPTNAAARGNLAMLYRMTGRPGLAIEQLRWVLEHQGTTRTARDRHAYLVQLAQAYAEAGDPQAAQRIQAEADKLAVEPPGGQ